MRKRVERHYIWPLLPPPHPKWSALTWGRGKGTRDRSVKALHLHPACPPPSSPSTKQLASSPPSPLGPALVHLAQPASPPFVPTAHQPISHNLAFSPPSAPTAHQSASHQLALYDISYIRLLCPDHQPSPHLALVDCRHKRNSIVGGGQHPLLVGRGGGCPV